ncbi:glutathione S-transferase family protein [Dongia deserti]|uniref:glutathione S-transferase family protein n=1 Tax=Dongia deserti TaxID=2268030 RepID=UPI000E6460FF|nr:glutathione S-transferase family protein [Dongia deserti]
MGLLVDGVWQPEAGRWADSRGRMQRPESTLRNWVTPDGSPGPTGRGGFKAEPGRYHLYIARACPWAHRTTIFRELKGLQEMIGLSVTHWLMLENGWTFDSAPGVVPDNVNDARYLYEIYVKSEPKYSGRVSVPVLWDKETKRIVNNESADIIRMFNSAFDGVGATPGDYYPEALRAEIDEVNARVYDTLNNGVYKAGFAGSQEAYDEAVVSLFETLDWLEQTLSKSQYLCGNRLTEADWRLFTTLLRFDPVYHIHFKCNLRRLVDYQALWRYARRLYQHPVVRPTVNFDHIKGHYFQSHRWINPTGIVPKGPIVDFEAAVG